MKKRVLAIMAVIALLFTASCSGKRTELLDFLHDDGEIDLFGQEFWFYSHWEENYHICDLVLGTPSLLLELKNDKFIETEKKYNVSIQFTIKDPMLQMSAGDGAYELMDNDLNNLYDYYKAGILYPAEDVASIDLSSGMWGNENFIKYGVFGGKQYCIFPWNWNNPETTGTMMYNGELVKSLGGTVPYEYQENGTWNWETFEKELRLYPKTVGDSPLTALYAQEYEVLGFTALHSNNLRIFDTTNGTDYSFGFNNNQAYETLDWLNSLYNDGLIGKGGMDTFTANNESVYYVGESYYGISCNPATEEKYAALVMDDYGFIAFPHGPNGTTDNVGSYTYGIRRLLGLSDKANIDIEIVGKIISSLFEPVKGYSDAMWKSELQNMVLQSEESYINYLMTIEHPEYNYSTQIDSRIDDVNEALSAAIKGSKTPTVAMDEIAGPLSEIAKTISENG